MTPNRFLTKSFSGFFPLFMQKSGLSHTAKSERTKSPPSILKGHSWAPEAIFQQPATECLRLATWNIHRGIGRDGTRDLRRTSRVISQIAPDLIGLQEVDNRIQGNGCDLEQLQDLTGLEVIAGPTMQHASGSYGNALLSRLPILDIERHDLNVKGREPRGVLIVHCDWHNERLQIAVTHLGLRPSERRDQVRRLISYLASEKRTPLILMGDFNEWLFFGRPLRWLRRHFGLARSPATFPSRWPLLRLDHILSDPPKRLQAIQTFSSPLAKKASDHLPLVARYFRGK